jgi:hypothetical protein
MLTGIMANTKQITTEYTIPVFLISVTYLLLVTPMVRKALRKPWIRCQHREKQANT